MLYHKRRLFWVVLVPDNFYVKKDVCCLALTVTICVYMAVVVRDKARFLSGEPRDLWHYICRLSFNFFGANTVVISAVMAVVLCEIERGFCLWSG